MIPIPPPPRRIYRPLNLRILKGLAWVFFAIIATATLVLLLALLNEFAWKNLGSDVPAAVTSLHERPNSGGTYDRVARYTYAPAPGHALRADSAPLTPAAFRDLATPFFTEKGQPPDMTFPPDKPGQLTVRAYALGPIVYGRPVDRDNGFLFMLIPAIFLPLGLIFTLLLYYKVVVVSRRHRHLYTHGIAVPGTIRDRRVTSDSDSISYQIAYEFTPANSDRPISAAMFVRGGDHNAATPGQQVTVLYDPKNPAKSTVFEYGGYKWL